MNNVKFRLTLPQSLLLASMTSFTAEAFSYLGLGVVCVLCRIHVRIQQQRGIRNLTADDYLMIFVLVPYTTEIVLAYFVGSRYSGLANGGMTDEQRATLQPGSTEYSWRYVAQGTRWAPCRSTDKPVGLVDQKSRLPDGVSMSRFFGSSKLPYVPFILVLQYVVQPSVIKTRLID